MLRRILLYLSEAGWAKALVSHFFLARRVALRFVAGETLDQAIAVIDTLNGKGLLVSIDYLGESVHEEADTREVVSMYLRIIDRIQAEALNASISLKLTHLGLDISEELCVNNLREILSAAKTHSIPITIDMESSAYTDPTLRIYRTVRDAYEFSTVGTVIQSALRRSSEDMRQLAEEGARIRLCKGAYLEPPEIAFPKKADVDAHYLQIVQAFIQAPPPAMLESATHDEAMIQATIDAANAHKIPPERFEIQMLYGIRSARQIELAQAGYQMRVYVPFGAQWYPYFMRRLAERPANLWFFVRSLFAR
jgi:proline dehydrogenase